MGIAISASHKDNWCKLTNDPSIIEMIMGTKIDSEESRPLWPQQIHVEGTTAARLSLEENGHGRDRSLKIVFFHKAISTSLIEIR